MEKYSSREGDFEMWVLLNHTRDAMFRVRQRELRQYSISIVRANVLFFLHANGGKGTPTEIGRWIFREPQSVSGLLDRMEKEGLVRRRYASALEGKQKSVEVLLTKKGRETYSRQRSQTESISKMMSCLSEKECQQLRTYLGKLQDKALGELGIGLKPSVIRHIGFA